MMTTNFMILEKKAEVHISLVPVRKLRLKVSSEKFPALLETLAKLSIDYGFNLSVEPLELALPQIREFRVDPQPMGVNYDDRFVGFTDELICLIQESGLSVRSCIEL